jgi:hypothetical protein
MHVGRQKQVRDYVTPAAMIALRVLPEKEQKHV